MSFFPKINEFFVCQNCGHENPPAPKTCRNHCCMCLYSLHVDEKPGDRASGCGGLLEPVKIVVSRGQMQSIVFGCQKCGKEGRNKIAEDDERGRLFEILESEVELKIPLR